MFYDNYKKVCKEHGYSPSGAAIKLGIGKSTVSSWKRDGSAPRAEQIVRIAELLDVSVDELLGVKKEMPVVEGLDEALIAMLKKLPEDKLQRVKDFVAGMISV